MNRRKLWPLALAVAGASCGGTALDPGAARRDDAAVDAAPAARYHGVVLAETIQGDSGDSYLAFADFANGGTPFGWAAAVGSHPAAGDCACVQGIATPDPFGVPDAATIRIADSGTGLLAELVPSTVTTDAGVSSATFHATAELGSLWYVNAGDYPTVYASAWSTGDVLHVRGSGGAFGVFSGQVTAGGRLTGVSPALAAGPLVISRDRDFAVSWAPDARPPASEIVLLSVRQVALDSVVACFCAVSDQAGTLVLPASLLALYAPDDQSCQLWLERLNVSTLDTPAGPVQLIAATAVSGIATVP